MTQLLPKGSLNSPACSPHKSSPGLAWKNQGRRGCQVYPSGLRPHPQKGQRWPTLGKVFPWHTQPAPKAGFETAINCRPRKPESQPGLVSRLTGLSPQPLGGQAIPSNFSQGNGPVFINRRAPPAPFFGKHSLNKQPIRSVIAKAAQSFNKSPGKIRTRVQSCCLIQ